MGTFGNFICFLGLGAVFLEFPPALYKGANGHVGGAGNGARGAGGRAAAAGGVVAVVVVVVVVVVLLLLLLKLLFRC